MGKSVQIASGRYGVNGKLVFLIPQLGSRALLRPQMQLHLSLADSGEAFSSVHTLPFQ